MQLGLKIESVKNEEQNISIFYSDASSSGGGGGDQGDMSNALATFQLSSPIGRHTWNRIKVTVGVQ